MQHLDEGTIHAWLDGALSPDESRQAESHVAGCAACASAVAEARGLIAASSMILSRLDGVLGTGDGQTDVGLPRTHDLAAARAAAAARQQPVRRRWFAAPGLRAAAAVLVLAGGVAVVQNVTGRDELARVVTNASSDAFDAREAEALPEAGQAVAQNATSAAAEQAPVAPPPPTVGPAPSLPRPAQMVGGMTPRRAPAAQTMVGDVSGVLGGATASANRSNVTPTAAPTLTESNAGRPGPGQGRAELRQELDLSAAAKAATPPAPSGVAAAPASPVPAEPPAPARADGAAVAQGRTADTLALRREARRLAEESAAPQQRFTPPAGVRGRLMPSVSAAVADAAEANASGATGRCYALTLSAWSPEQPTIPGAPATRIILSADTGTVGPSKGQRLVRPVPGAFAGSYDHAWYTEVSPSTIVLTWATGTEGIVMRLVRSGDLLTGTARTFGAAGGVERTSAVRGERVECDGAR